MFPFQSVELSFQISNDGENNTSNTNTSSTLTHHQLLQLNNAHLANNSNNNLIISSPKTRKGRSSKSTTTQHNNNNNNANNKKEDEISGNDAAKKKIIHREIERQRRQEMSELHSSLRSLLPMEYIKGKRSICDHVTEATKYIQDLEKNIKMLGEKRDKLKESCCNSSSSENLPNKRDFRSSSSSNASSVSGYNVSIQKFSRTLQIEIAAGIEEEDPYPLSKVFKVLGEEGLEVVSSVSSKVNQRWIYVIYCEVNDVTTVDSSHLQEKLMSLVTSYDS